MLNLKYLCFVFLASVIVGFAIFRLYARKMNNNHALHEKVNDNIREANSILRSRLKSRYGYSSSSPAQQFDLTDTLSSFIFFFTMLLMGVAVLMAPSSLIYRSIVDIEFESLVLALAQIVFFAMSTLPMQFCLIKLTKGK